MAPLRAVERIDDKEGELNDIADGEPAYSERYRPVTSVSQDVGRSATALLLLGMSTCPPRGNRTPFMN
jgi:hypothetical protein